MEDLNSKDGRDAFFNRLLREAIEEADQRGWWKVTRAKNIDLLVNVAENYYRVAEQLQKHQQSYADAAGSLDLRILGIDPIPQGMTKEELIENRDFMLQQADSYRRSVRMYSRKARWVLRRVAWLDFVERVFHRD